MSLYIQDRVKEQESDDQTSEKNVVFTFPWIFNFPIQNQNPDNEMNVNAAARAYFKTSYKMASTSWNVFFKNEYDAIVVKNIYDEEWNGSCYISFTLYYDAEMRLEFFSSTRTQMTRRNEQGNGTMFRTPKGYMTRFIEAANKKKFSKCVIFVEVHLPIKYFYQSPFEKEPDRYRNKTIDKFPDDLENNFRFEFLKKGDYLFECLDGTVPAQRRILFISSETMKKQLSSPRHYPVGTVMYTVAVVKPIMIYFHSECFKLPESFNFEYIDRLLHAIEFFEPNLWRKDDMITKVEGTLCEKFVKEKHDFNLLLEWLSFSIEHFLSNLKYMIYSLIANEYYFKWNQTFPVTARNIENALYRQLFGRAEAARNAPNQIHFQFDRTLAEHIFGSIDEIYKQSFLTNVILQ